MLLGERGLRAENVRVREGQMDEDDVVPDEDEEGGMEMEGKEDTPFDNEAAEPIDDIAEDEDDLIETEAEEKKD